MKDNRRDFLKKTGLTGIGLFGGLFGTACSRESREENGPYRLTHSQQFNMHGYAAPALETVRVGVTGLGNRGSGTVQRFASIEGVEIRALNDLEPDRVERAAASIAHHAVTPDHYHRDENDWKRMCERDDIDLIAIATPWHLHVPQAVYAMENGKHVYVELPAANTVEECWQLVETSERTRKHCIQMSASCHYGISAVVLNMVRDGLFGEIIHGEGGYIHDLLHTHIFTPDTYHDLWRLKENIDRDGNLYPQHGLVPVMQMMDINYGDQMDHMVAMSTNDFMMNEKAKEMAAGDGMWEQFVDRNYRGNLNTTLIRTHRGRTMMIQHDVTTPRPGIRFDLISGTKGTFKARPGRIGFSYYDGWISDEEYQELEEKYKPEITKIFEELVRQAEETRQRPTRGYARVNAMDWRLIDCLHNGLPVESDVYDAAISSVVTPLSEWSVANGSAPAKVPDFTGGSWKTNERGMDLNIRRGGTTRII